MNKKRNNLYVVILYLLMLCGATACTDATDPAPGGPVEPAAGTIRLTLSLPGKTPVNSRAATTIPGTPEENRIDSIRLYAFMATDGGAITGNAILENIYTLATEELTLADGDGNTYTANLRLNETGAVRLVAVANPEATLVPGPLGDNGLRPGITYAKFCTAVTLSLSHTPRTPLLMWGDADGTVTTDGTTPLAISLTRSVARIDVVNNTLEREEDGTPSTTQPQGSMTYNIERISLVNAPSAAWLTPMPEGNERTGTPPATPLLTQQQTTIDLATHQDWQAAYAVQRIAGGLYCFPTTNADAAATVRLAIEGKLNGQPVRHIVAWEEGQPIQPNRLYHVVIDSVQTTIVHARILVSEWEDGGEIDYSPTAGTLKAEFTDDSGILYHTSANNSLIIITGSPDMDTKNPDETLEMTFSVRITSDYVKAEVWKSHNWIECEETGSNTDQDGRIVQEFTVTATRIPGQEEGSIEFFNPAKPYEKVEYLFIDDNPANPLSRFAHANLADDQEFAPAPAGLLITDESQLGGLFQFGRNIAVSKGTTLDVDYTTGRIDINDAVKSNIFAVANGQYVWFSNTSSRPASDYWYNLYNIDVPGGQQNGDYRGDPCPTGWRLPTIDEMISVMRHALNTGSNANYNTSLKEHTYATVETGPGFESLSSTVEGLNVCYAVKRKETPDAYVLRYRIPVNDTPRNMEVTCIMAPGFTATAPAGFTDGTIDWEDPRRVVRYFPLGGQRTSAAAPTTTEGYYWFNKRAGDGNIIHYFQVSTARSGIMTPVTTDNYYNRARSLRCVRVE